MIRNSRSITSVAMRIPLKIGTDCLHTAMAIALIILPRIVIASTIAPPPTPKGKTPPSTSNDEAYDDLRRMQKKRRSRERREFPKRPNRNRAEKLKKLDKNPGPMVMGMNTSLVLPYALTIGNNYKNFVADPSVFWNLYIRATTSQPPEKSQLWWGFRLAPISGTGISENTAGRFGFLHFGPIVGLGKVSRADFTPRPKGKEPSAKDRDAHFWTGGISFLNRTGKVESGRAEPTDFNNKGLTIDVPGLWTEYMVASIKHHRIGNSYTIGLQTGKNKLIIYCAIGMSMWH